MKSGTVNSTLTRGYGTLGGLGIIGAAVFAVPEHAAPGATASWDGLLLDDRGAHDRPGLHGLPWERIDPRWLHVVGVLATVEAAWAVAVFGQAYLALFFLIAVSVAYMTPDARSLLPHSS